MKACLPHQLQQLLPVMLLLLLACTLSVQASRLLATAAHATLEPDSAPTVLDFPASFPNMALGMWANLHATCVL